MYWNDMAKIQDCRLKSTSKQHYKSTSDHVGIKSAYNIFQLLNAQSSYIIVYTTMEELARMNNGVLKKQTKFILYVKHARYY